MIQPIVLLGVKHYEVSGTQCMDGCYTITQLLELSTNEISRFSLINRLSNLEQGRGKFISVLEAITIPMGATNIQHDPIVLASLIESERKFIDLMMLWNVCKLKPLIMQSRPL